MAILKGSRLIVGLLLLGAGCGREATPPSMERGSYQILAGVVVDDLGTPVAGAAVRITGVLNGSTGTPHAAIGGCSGWRTFVDSLQMTSGNGHFEKRVGFGPASSPLCIAVEVFPPSGSLLKDGLGWLLNVYPTGRTDMPDTTRISVQLASK